MLLFLALGCPVRTESDSDADCSPAEWFDDQDGDGYGASEGAVDACEAPADHVALSGDCDDLDEAVFPGAVEICDGVDQDCDGVTDEACKITGTLSPTAAQTRIMGVADSNVWRSHTLGDVDGDGSSGILVGGRFLFHEAPVGDVYLTDADSILTMDCGDGGQLVATSPAGDIDADGVPDVLVIERCIDEMTASYLSAATPSGAIGAVAIGHFEFVDPLQGYLGTMAGSDVTGDSHSDVALVTTDAGTSTVHVFAGPLAAVATSDRARTTISGESTDFGLKLAAGDLDGSGTADLAVSSPQEVLPEVAFAAGAVYVFQDMPEGSLSMGDADARISATAADDRAGSDVHAAADLNGDGTSDLVVSTGSGGYRYYVMFGPPASGTLDDADVYFGSSMNWAAVDFDGDGNTDVAVAQEFARSYIYYGPFLSGSYSDGDGADVVIPGVFADAFPDSIAAAGDVDGDGRGDLLITARDEDTPAADLAGVVYLFTGGP